MNKILNVKCPNCETTFDYYKSEFRPFCSERCKMVDLGHWLKESYRVPVKDNQTYDNQKDYEENYEENYDEDQKENIKDYSNSEEENTEDY